MNRNVAQTARVLEVNSTQVKAWAFMFKEYLSTQANPGNGKTRVFNDSDVLVLAYVCTSWEAKPDLDSIHAGLNDDEHHQKELYEHLYQRCLPTASWKKTQLFEIFE